MELYEVTVFEISALKLYIFKSFLQCTDLWLGREESCYGHFPDWIWETIMSLPSKNLFCQICIISFVIYLFISFVFSSVSNKSVFILERLCISNTRSYLKLASQWSPAPPKFIIHTPQLLNRLPWHLADADAFICKLADVCDPVKKKYYLCIIF